MQLDMLPPSAFIQICPCAVILWVVFSERRHDRCEISLKISGPSKGETKREKKQTAPAIGIERA